jgi:hypothetical protein
MAITIVNVPAISSLSNLLPEVAIDGTTLLQIAAQDILK